MGTLKKHARRSILSQMRTIPRSTLALLILCLLTTPGLIAKAGTPQVLLLSGTSTTGKTTTAAYFLRNHPEWTLDGWDLALFRESEFMPQKGITKDEDVQTYLNGVIADSAVAALQDGKSIILDIGDAEAMTQLLVDRGIAKDSITAVLLYVPPSLYLDRVEERNRFAIFSGKLEEAREPLDMLSQYPKFYIISKDPKLKLDSLSEKQLKELLDRAYQDSVALLQKMGASEEEMAYLESEKTPTTDNTIHSMGFSNTLTEGYLTPRYQGYVLIINTGKDSPEEASKQLSELVHGQASPSKKP